MPGVQAKYSLPSSALTKGFTFRILGSSSLNPADAFRFLFHEADGMSAADLQDRPPHVRCDDFRPAGGGAGQLQRRRRARNEKRERAGIGEREVSRRLDAMQDQMKPPAPLVRSRSQDYERMENSYTSSKECLPDESREVINSSASTQTECCAAGSPDR